MTIGKWFWALYLAYALLGSSIALLTAGYADVVAAILAATMLSSGIWLSAKGMAQLKRPDNLSDAQLEIAYRCRNAGIALALTGSGLLVFSWQHFLARFIVAGASSGM